MLLNFECKNDHSVADPGFSQGGAPTPKMGLLTYYFAFCCRKLQENKTIRLIELI